MPTDHPAPARIPDGQRVYAIGDVHGCLGKLDALLSLIAEDAATAPEQTARLVFLGDYVDRGADSRGALERLMQPPPLTAGVVTLIGNHEVLMLNALRPTPNLGQIVTWLENGGRETLESYGVAVEDGPEVWRDAIPMPHMALLNRLERRHAIGGYLFVHAGIRPGVALDQQDENDLVWIREPFLSSSADHGAVVVHGHTPGEAAVLRHNRMGIDTGAVYGGRLTALALWGERMRLLQV